MLALEPMDRLGVVENDGISLWNPSTDSCFVKRSSARTRKVEPSGASCVARFEAFITPSLSLPLVVLISDDLDARRPLLTRSGSCI